mgnify:CR=1 FL=1
MGRGRCLRWAIALKIKRLVSYLRLPIWLLHKLKMMKPPHQSAFKCEAKVLEGNRLEIQLPPEAKLDSSRCRVEVIVLLPHESEQVKYPSMQEILAKIHQQHSGGRTVKQINQDLGIERESWDS